MSETYFEGDFSGDDAMGMFSTFSQKPIHQELMRSGGRDYERWGGSLYWQTEEESGGVDVAQRLFDEPHNPFRLLDAATVQYLGLEVRGGTTLHHLFTNKWMGEPMAPDAGPDPVVFDVFVDDQGLPVSARLMYVIHMALWGNPPWETTVVSEFTFSDIGFPTEIGPVEPTWDEPPVTAIESPALHFEDADEGATLTLDLDRNEVERGGEIHGTLRLTNTGSVPILHGYTECYPTDMFSVELRPPLFPYGHEWDGMAGDLKRAALRGGAEGGPTSTIVSHSSVTPCFDELKRPLPPGGTFEWQIEWRAGLDDGIPAPRQIAPFTASISHAPELDANGEPQGIVRTLVIRGEVSITGDGELASAGEAIDAVLADDDFMAWLGEMPPSTWSGTGTRIESARNWGVLPRGEYWVVELFRELGVPRNFAIAGVDILSGELVDVSYCNDPCNR